MNSNELKSFLMAYEYRSFTIAAKRLHIAPSTISKRISNLEQVFKVKLFEMRGNMLFPTTEGKQLIPYARSLLHTMCNALDNFKNPQLSEIPVIIGISAYPSLQFLPRFINYLIKNEIIFPNFQIKQMPKPSLVSALQNGMIDIALTSEDLIVDSEIKSNPLKEEDVFFIATPTHELAQEKNIGLKELSQYPCILTQRGFAIRDNLEFILLTQGLTLFVEHELLSLDAIKLLVKTGLGWSALPEQYFDDELVKLELQNHSQKITLCWYCHKNRFESKLIQYIGQLLSDGIKHIYIA
ncbi:HTH-type transcriptional regulator GltC [Legionella massiliensis]|uniref:HTH-type transcriptional regulator GltC n=1 Tax=Legionella massiliensis TaxID=1034943 RepID=A0A078KZK9_9GAMM|nr:LysR family transcriptional regulator [Legionella massiliensis]CDZ77234.1 HTH-type transcriptional regulator GltC [Legionella massiliensis]CEE12972.1 HTH-type transcriptional regulator GltC [Legionella massiliensis]